MMIRLTSNKKTLGGGVEKPSVLSFEYCVIDNIIFL